MHGDTGQKGSEAGRMLGRDVLHYTSRSHSSGSGACSLGSQDFLVRVCGPLVKL